jgi:hypothetical protein
MNKLHRQWLALGLALAQGAVIAALARPLSPREVASLTRPASALIDVSHVQLTAPDVLSCQVLALDAP